MVLYNINIGDRLEAIGNGEAAISSKLKAHGNSIAEKPYIVVRIS